ncbi:SWIM zinc finger family protein [Bradyrhizobium sp. WSM1743]
MPSIQSEGTARVGIRRRPEPSCSCGRGARSRSPCSHRASVSPGP